MIIDNGVGFFGSWSGGDCGGNGFGGGVDVVLVLVFLSWWWSQMTKVALAMMWCGIVFGLCWIVVINFFSDCD